MAKIRVWDSSATEVTARGEPGIAGSQNRNTDTQTHDQTGPVLGDARLTAMTNVINSYNWPPEGPP